MSDGNRYPKLRPVETQWIERAGQPALLLQDRLAIGARSVVVPRALAPLLALCDGTRSPAALQAALALRTGIRLDLALIERVLSQLDDALMLDNQRFADAYRQAVEAYRSSPFRPALLAGSGYPAEPADLAAMLDRYLAEAADRRDGEPPASRPPLGLICPHIDYDRGGQVYARVWDGAREAVAKADLFVVLGTDHSGGPAELTLTCQSYHTPFGILRTDLEAVETVAEALGPEAAFRSELNHRAEHSIELAAVWLHHLVGGRDVRLLPVLCGSFHPFTHGEGHPTADERWQAGTSALRRIVERGRTLVIAAADLAHVGPAFGDPTPVGLVERAQLSASDQAMLATVCRGDAGGFLDLLAAEEDRRRVCGLPPIYLALQVLGEVMGEVVAYSICPAPNGSAVSVAGVLLRSPSP